MRKHATPNRLRIATLPAIAQLWLSGRLGKLRKLIPELTVSVYSFETAPNMQREPFDIALFFSEEPLRDPEVALCQDCIFPVCTPKVGAGIRSTSDLENAVLLKDSAWFRDWEIWLHSLNEPQIFSPKGPVFSLFSVALEETLNGAGFLIAHEALVQKFLADGRLVAPFKHKLLLNRTLVMKPTFEMASNSHFKQICDVLCNPL